MSENKDIQEAKKELIGYALFKWYEHDMARLKKDLKAEFHKIQHEPKRFRKLQRSSKRRF